MMIVMMFNTASLTAQAMPNNALTVEALEFVAQSWAEFFLSAERALEDVEQIILRYGSRNNRITLLIPFSLIIMFIAT